MSEESRWEGEARKERQKKDALPVALARALAAARALPHTCQLQHCLKNYSIQVVLWHLQARAGSSFLTAAELELVADCTGIPLCHRLIYECC